MKINESLTLKSAKSLCFEGNFSQAWDKFNQLTHSNDSEKRAEGFYWLSILEIKRYGSPQQALYLCTQAIQNNSNHGLAYYLAAYINLDLGHKSCDNIFLEEARRYYNLGQQNKYLYYEVQQFFDPFINTEIY